MASLHLTVLITSLLPDEEGKTEIALGLVEGLRSRGVSVGYYKPFSVFDYYRDYVAVEASMDEGVLVPPEILSLRELGLKVDDPCLVAPVTALTAPLRPEVFIEARAPSSFFSYSTDFLRRLVAFRAALYEPARTIITYFNGWSISRNVLRVDYSSLGRLSRRSDHVARVDSILALSETYERVSLQSLRTTYPKVSSKHRVLLVDSLRNSAWPLPPDAEVWLVVAVTRGTAVIYDGRRYKAAVALKSGGSVKYLRQLTTADVFTLVYPRSIVEIPPFHPFEPLESRAEKLGGVVESIISLFEKASA